MADIIRAFDAGMRFDERQERELGDIVYDDIGRRFRYVRFDQAGGLGICMRDEVTDDLLAVAGTEGTVSEAIDAGSVILKATGAFAGKDLVGAFGQIVDGDGIGDSFWITDNKANNDDEVEVFVLASGSEFRGQNEGWSADLGTDSDFTLYFPGAVRRASGLNQAYAGFPKIPITTADLGKFGYVQQTGMGWAALAGAGVAGNLNEGLVVNSDGRLVGMTATPTTDQIASIVAKARLGDVRYTANGLAFVEFCVENNAKSFSLTDWDNPIDENLTIA